MMTTRGGAGGGAEKRPSDPRRAASSADGAVASTDAWISEGGLERPNVHAQLSVHKHSNQNSVPA